MQTRSLNISILSIEHPLEPLVRRGLAIVLVGLFVAYTYFICASVVHIVARKDARVTSDAVAARVANLEASAAVAIQQITPERATMVGLVPVSDKTYVNRTTYLGLGTQPNNEI